MHKITVMNYIVLALWVAVLVNVVAMLLGRGRYAWLAAAICAGLAILTPHVENYCVQRFGW